LPSTPAPAILVVLVMTDCCPAVDGGLPVSDPHPPASATTTAVRVAVEAATGPVRRLLIRTSPTLTSGHFPAGRATS